MKKINELNYKKSILGGTIAFIIGTSCCWLPALIIAAGGGSALLGLSKGLEKSSAIFMGIGILFVGFGIYQFWIKYKRSIGGEAILQSTITCPNCNYSKEETMPTDACQYFYECDNCHTVLKPLEGDCCVYCSYGTVACPPIQLNQECC